MKEIQIERQRDIDSEKETERQTNLEMEKKRAWEREIESERVRERGRERKERWIVKETKGKQFNQVCFDTFLGYLQGNAFSRPTHRITQ